MALTPPSRRHGARSGRRLELPAIQGGLCLTLVVAVGCAVIALRVNQHEMARTAQIDESLRHLAHVRAATGEIGRGARRYVLSGDVEDRQLVGAMAADLRAEREELGRGLSVAETVTLDTSFDRYVATVTRAMDVLGEDFLTRLDRFEVSLLDARNELVPRIDQIAARHHRQRDDALESRTVARVASWATTAACIAALALALALVIRAERRRANHRPSVEARDREILEAGWEGPAHLAPHDVGALVDHAIAERRLDAQARHVRLRNEARGATKVLADDDRIQYVLDTLLELAIVRSRPGDEVTVHVAAGDEDVRIAVIDTGQRSPMPTADRYHELCRHVIESQGGRFVVQSAVAGTTSWFTLPRAT